MLLIEERLHGGVGGGPDQARVAGVSVLAAVEAWSHPPSLPLVLLYVFIKNQDLVRFGHFVGINDIVSQISKIGFKFIK